MRNRTANNVLLVLILGAILTGIVLNLSSTLEALSLILGVAQ